MFVLLAVLLLPGWSAAELLLRNTTTVAGRYGASGTTDGPVASATLAGPSAVAPAFASTVTEATPLVIADSELIRIVEGGTVTTLFGKAGVVGLVNGNKTAARVNSATSMVYAADDGYVYFTEPRNNVIRRLNKTHVEGFAGSTTGAGGFADGTGSAALFLTPSSIAYARYDDAWYVADTANSALRRITRAGVVTTPLTGIDSPFYAAATGEGRVFLLNRPTSFSVGVVIFYATNQTSVQWIATASTNYVAIGYDADANRLFAASANRVHELFLTNGSFSVVAGVGTAYLDGPNPRFNYVNNMYVSSYRNMYLVSGPQAYVVRRLYFDPPPPVPVSVVFASPTIFPLDNTTALNTTLRILQDVVNAQLGTNGTTTIGTVVFDYSRRQTNITILVPNETYTNTSQSTLQFDTNYTSVLASLDAYYALTDFALFLDPLKLPFLFEGNISAIHVVRELLEAEARAAFQFAYIFTAPPTFVTNASDGANLTSWKLLLPASFQNGTSANVTTAMTHSSSYSFGATLYAPDVFIHLSDETFPLPYSNATAMQEIRQLLQRAAEEMFAYRPCGVDALQRNTTNDTTAPSYNAKLYVPSNFSPATNATTRALLGNATWDLLSDYLDAFYPNSHRVVFDATKFPFTDAASVAAVAALVRTEANRVIAGNASSTAIGVDRSPVVNLTDRTVTFRLLVPAIYDTTLDVDALLLASPFADAYAYLYQFYQRSSSTYDASFLAMELPVLDAQLMETLRLAIGDDLAAALNFTDVGANSSVPSFSGVNSSGTVIGPTVRIRFPLLFPPWMVGTSALNTTLGNLTFPIFHAALQRSLLQGLNVTVDSSLLPVNNATAMELLRQQLTLELRRLANASNGAVSLLPAVTINGSAVLYQVLAPVGSLDGIDVAELLQSFLARANSPTGTLAAFVASYYPSGFNVSLSFDITPWSNSTTMDALNAKIVEDVTAVLTTIATTSDAVHVTEANVSKASRLVTFTLLVPPVYGGANLAGAKAALRSSRLPITNAFLDEYFPKNISVTLDGNLLPWADASAMAAVRVLVADFLSENIFRYENIGVNASVYNATDGRVYFKVIVPPSFDNASTAANVSTSLNISSVTALTAFLATYYPENYVVSFASGTLPTTNATAMEAIRALLQLDLVALFKYPSVGVESMVESVDNNTGVTSLTFPLLLPPSFDNGTTVQLLIAGNYTRVAAYLAAYYATPAPPTPVPQFVYTSQWPVDSMPSFNETQMGLLGDALLQDVINMLKISPSVVTVSSWQLSSDGVYANYIVTLPSAIDNATTGVLLQDVNNYPIFQALLSSLTQGNQVSIGSVLASVDEGCSRGCVIGVAAVGAVIVTAGIVAIVVKTSKKRRTATVIAPKFSSVVEEGVEDDDEMQTSPQRSRKARNPLDMA